MLSAHSIGSIAIVMEPILEHAAIVNLAIWSIVTLENSITKLDVGKIVLLYMTIEWLWCSVYGLIAQRSVQEVLWTQTVSTLS